MPEKAFPVCIKDSVFIDPACGSGGMFVQTGDFVEHAGMLANNTMTFYGQEKVEYNVRGHQVRGRGQHLLPRRPQPGWLLRLCDGQSPFQRG